MKKIFVNRYGITILVLFLTITGFSIYWLISRGDSKRNIDIQSSITPTNDGKFKVIGLIADNMQDRVTYDVFTVIKAYSKENNNIKIILYDSEGKTDKQLIQLSELINKNVDGIIISPINDQLPEPVLRRIKLKGIPIILLNNGVSSEEVSCIIKSPSIKIGEVQGEYISKKLNGKGNVLIFTGPESLIATKERFEGFNNVTSKYPQLKLIRIPYGMWNKNNYGVLFNDIISSYGDIDCVVEQYNDLIIQELQLNEKFKIKPLTIGMDALPEVLEALKGGMQDATVYIKSSDTAAKAFETVMKLIKKEAVPKLKNIPINLITTENVDSYIERNLNFKIK